jgi:uncharacterized OB-fold protein
VGAVTALPAHAPPYSEEAAPFWSGLAEGRLDLPVCDTCGHHIWYPRTWCPVCGGHDVTWTTLSGRGVVYARTVLHRAMGPWADAAPFAIAYVELAEGPRVLTNIVADDPGAVLIGMPVAAVFVPVDEPDGSPATHLLRFRPTP